MPVLWDRIPIDSNPVYLREHDRIGVLSHKYAESRTVIFLESLDGKSNREPLASAGVIS